MSTGRHEFPVTKTAFRVAAGASVAGALALAFLLVTGQRILSTADQSGARQLAAGQFDRAAETFHDPLWKATALFRGGGFKEAATLFSGFDTADAAFNHGNSLVMLGKYEDAVARYDRALELHQGWDAAITNRAIAVARAGRVKLEGGDMTGGMLGADEISFDTGKSNNNSGEEEVEDVDGQGQGISDAEMRALWLRRVDTRPADFLRSKFAYQRSRAPD